MSTLTNHYLLITHGDNEHVRARVVDAKVLTPQLLILHIETPEWVDHNPHHAEYVTPVDSMSGCFTVAMYDRIGRFWEFKGGFKLDSSEALVGCLLYVPQDISN